MIAAKKNCRTGLFQTQEGFDHLSRCGSAVDVIAEENELVIFCGFDAVQQCNQSNVAAVNVAYGKSAHVCRLNSPQTDIAVAEIAAGFFDAFDLPRAGFLATRLLNHGFECVFPGGDDRGRLDIFARVLKVANEHVLPLANGGQQGVAFGHNDSRVIDSRGIGKTGKPFSRAFGKGAYPSGEVEELGPFWQQLAFEPDGFEILVRAWHRNSGRFNSS